MYFPNLPRMATLMFCETWSVFCIPVAGQPSNVHLVSKIFIDSNFCQNYAPVICIHSPPHLRGWPWNSRAKVQGNDFLIVPTVLGNYREFYPSEIYCCVGWGLEQGCYHQLVPTAHLMGGNREQSLIFRKIVNDCHIKRFRLPKRQSTNSK